MSRHHILSWMKREVTGRFWWVKNRSFCFQKERPLGTIWMDLSYLCPGDEVAARRAVQIGNPWPHWWSSNVWQSLSFCRYQQLPCKSWTWQNFPRGGGFNDLEWAKSKRDVEDEVVLLYTLIVEWNKNNSWVCIVKQPFEEYFLPEKWSHREKKPMAQFQVKIEPHTGVWQGKF